MAKRRRKHHRRRHYSRIGKVAMGDILQKFVGLGLGASVGFFANDLLKKSFTSLPTFVPGAILAVAGAFSEQSLGAKNKLISAASTGLETAGLLIVLNETIINLPGISGVGFVTNYDKNYKNNPALMRAVGAPGFMDNSIGTVRDLASVGTARMGAIYDN